MLMRSSTSKTPSETAISIVAIGVFVLFMIAVVIGIAMEPREPDQQKQFLEIVKKYRDSYNATNDLANPTYQSQRTKAICELFNGNLSVTDWFGNVKNFWHMSDGRVGLAVSFPRYERADPYVILSGEQALISPSDPLNKKILSLCRRRDLYFSGQFMPSTKDCIHEVRMTTDGITETQWLFKFDSVRQKIPGPGGGR
jgi:hypothetical protein